MKLENTDLRKVIVIKTKSQNVMRDISNMIHSQLMGKDDYRESRIILSLGDSFNKEIPENEIHVYIFNDCTINPIIVIGKFLNCIQIVIDISVKTKDEEFKLLSDIESQLYNNRDRMFSNILVLGSDLKKDFDINGYTVRVIYNDDRKSTPSIII